MVTMDGGLERLVHILRASPRRVPTHIRDASVYNDLQGNWKWSLAFQCVVNIGVRGSEAIRTRVVEAGMAPIIVRVLESFLIAADSQKEEFGRRAMQAEPHEMRRSVYPSTEQEHAENVRDPTPDAASIAASTTRPATPMEMEVVLPSSASVHDTEMDSAHAEGSASSCWTDRSMNDTERTRSHANECFGDASASGSASECAEDTEMYTEGEEAESGKRDAVDATPRPRGHRLDEPRGAAQETSPSAAPLRHELLDAARTPRPTRTVMPDMRAEAPRAPMPSHVYREEEVLMSLQLLAYLSKYPHVRLFFHNADVRDDMLFCPEWPEETMPNRSWSPSDPVKRNVFSVAERFTLRSSRSTGSTGALNAFFPRLGHEIQYWAGVVMRNACRKDESRGGIRQCANMLCGKWESYPREFAKCRRCRKAKYCSKQCQSKGWQMGHRFWCSARDDAEGRDVKKKDAPRTASHPEPEMEVGTPMHAQSPAPEPVPQAPPVPAQPAEQHQHYMRPLGARALPSTMVRSTSQQMPQMRGVSAASVETIDPDMSDSVPPTAPPSDAPSPALAPRTGGPFNGHPLPPPIIAGSLNVHESDPAATTLREHEVQDVQDHGVLEVIAASWPAQGRPPASPSSHERGVPEDYDLGIHLPNNPVLLPPSSPGSDEANGAYGARRVSALTSWNMSRQLSVRNRHRTARAISSSLLSNSISASDLTMDDAPHAAEAPRLSTNNLRNYDAYSASQTPEAALAMPASQLFSGMLTQALRTDPALGEDAEMENVWGPSRAW